MGNSTVFSMNLEGMQVRTVRDCTHLKVKEIKVMARPVDIPVVKYLGAEHMFLVLELENGVLIINHISDGDGGKGAKVVFEKLPESEVDEKHTTVLEVRLKSSPATLQDMISYAKQYQEDHPTYKILSKNCQFYCVEMLKKLHIEDHLIIIVSNYSDDNMQTTALKGGLGLAVALAGIGLAAQGLSSNDEKKKKDEFEDLLAQLDQI
ncbi:hypothetical protein TTHERM_01087800 (macronuclear) [Tetrahymena thermophila SB210]|uniref:Uncharacterized protein n=1 Tax=Tetrahymena thermophila (strain SB210) TaxID=312017 RepID=Q23M86_TETTS|nr:hypothetical protein TTHERM_01087800 [Tetrahymena thermophila SB210]EAR97627.1 hypothetical protein TTHERM_01087800 [Tetrahymena thermophila SB210]|eukprot:XP_001017872.1 hypothetical protein TTHERM_01087800 [Tetrahymena thermophila SB210]